MKCCAAVLAVFAGAALSAVGASGQASAPSTPAQKAPPSFQAAGPRSATAPSGYSDGVTQQRAQTTSGLIPLLQRQSLLRLLPRDDARGCAHQEALRSAAAGKPRDLAANLHLGWFNLLHDRPAEALEPLRAAARIAPEDARPKIALTIAFIETNDEEQAQATLDALRAMHVDETLTARLSAALPLQTGSPAGPPTSAGVAYTEGLARLSSGEAAQARCVFAAGLAQRAVKPKERGDLLLGMGLADALQGAQQQASAELLDASQNDPRNLVSSTLLAAWITPDAVEAQQAVAAVKQTAQRLSGSALARYNVATLMARITRQGRSAEQQAAIETAYRQALVMDPRLAAAHFGLGELDGERGDKVEAIHQMRQAILLEPGIAEWHYRLFRELEAAGMHEEAAREIAVFRSLRSDAGGEAGDATLLRGIPTESLQEFAGPCELNPSKHSASSTPF